MAMYLRDLMYLSGWTDRGAEPSFWEKIQETLSRQFFDVSVTPGARLWNFPYWSGGGGLRWDQAYDNTGWGGHPFHPLGSRSKESYISKCFCVCLSVCQCPS